MIDARRMHNQVINAWHLNSIYPRKPLGKPQGKSSPGRSGKGGKSAKSAKSSPGKGKPARRNPADSWQKWD